MKGDIKSILNESSDDDSGIMDKLGQVLTRKRKDSGPAVYIACPYEPIEEIQETLYEGVIPILEDLGVRIMDSVGKINAESIQDADIVVAFVDCHGRNCEVGVQVGLAYHLEKPVLVFRYNFDMEEDWSLEPWLVFITDETDGAVVYNLSEFRTAMETFLEDLNDTELAQPTL